MWQQSSNKSRVPEAKKTSDRRLHLKRVTAEIRVAGLATLGASVPPLEVRILLNDINPQGVLIFTKDPLVAGQLMNLTLEAPARLYVRARVTWCTLLSLDKNVVSAETFGWRCGLQFEFQSVAEQATFRSACEAIQREHVYLDAPVSVAPIPATGPAQAASPEPEPASDTTVDGVGPDIAEAA